MVYTVLHLIDSNRKRGAETFAVQLAESMSAEKFVSTLCVLHPLAGDGHLHSDMPTINLKRRGNGKSRLSLPKVMDLHKAVREVQPDVVLAHGSSALQYGAVASMLYPNALAVYRNIGLASFWVRNPIKARMNRLLMRRFDAIVSLTGTTKADFLQVYKTDSDRVTTIPNGVNLEPFRAVDGGNVRESYREAMGIGHGEILLISVGSLSWEKGPMDLMPVLAALRADGLPVRLVMVGEGPLSDGLRTEAHALGIASHVDILGVRQDVPQLMAASDIFVLPSRTEGLPAALIEAGLSGLPSVANDVGAVSDVITHGETGLIIDAGDAGAFNDAIVRLVRDDALRSKMGAAASAFCEANFAMDLVAAQYEDLFMSLISSN
ncbi:MAG: glycosyltransferase family 4 protein [Chloroflexi bacterium]|nr:glycosyltransferase family 4 protein [Chloroflexota bacterium]